MMAGWMWDRLSVAEGDGQAPAVKSSPGRSSPQIAASVRAGKFATLPGTDHGAWKAGNGAAATGLVLPER